MKRFTFKDLASINQALFELTCLRRWSEVTVEPGKYTELAKQGLNCMIAYIWAIEASCQGIAIDFSVFPKVAIMRAFAKTILCDIPEINFERIFATGKVSKKSFDEMIQQQVSKITTENFRNQLSYEDGIEVRIFKAATKLATILELKEIKPGISRKDYEKKFQILFDEWKSFSDLPGFSQMNSEKYLELFKDFSQIRNRIRWAKHPNIIKCSVLGHHFDVAVLAYLMSLEVKPHDEALAAHFFFMGIFHDLPEKWTGDIPSPIKDSIPGLRSASEEFENQVMKENVYSILPEYQVNALRDVMLEDEINASYKKFLKKSDNLAAFIECWREIDAGSKHYYYLEVLQRDFESKENLPEAFRLLVEKLYGSVIYH